MRVCISNSNIITLHWIWTSLTMSTTFQNFRRIVCHCNNIEDYVDSQIKSNLLINHPTILPFQVFTNSNFFFDIKKSKYCQWLISVYLNNQWPQIIFIFLLEKKRWQNGNVLRFCHHQNWECPVICPFNHDRKYIQKSSVLSSIYFAHHQLDILFMYFIHLM